MRRPSALILMLTMLTALPTPASAKTCVYTQSPLPEDSVCVGTE